MYISVSSRLSKRYGLTLYSLAKSRDFCIYLSMLPSEIVNINLPPHLVHLPFNGGRRYLLLQLTQRNPCIENFLKLPLVSLMKCLSIINLATSLASTALILLQSIICSFTLSFIVGR